jgi:plastocyanin
LIPSLLVAILAFTCVASAQTAENRVTGTVNVRDSKGVRGGEPNAVVWLTAQGVQASAKPSAPGTFRLTQKNKRFEPHLLVVPIDSSVDFPNADHFFHNVFSVYEGTRFDLGLYESGSTKRVKFSRPGASYIFCNIHPEMSAVVMVMMSPYYAVTSQNGQYTIEDVPDGEYTLQVWFERARPEQLKELSRKITVSGNLVVPTLNIDEAPSPSEGHTNKYGQDYEKAPDPKY